MRYSSVRNTNLAILLRTQSTTIVIQRTNIIRSHGKQNINSPATYKPDYSSNVAIERRCSAWRFKAICCIIKLRTNGHQAHLAQRFK